MSDRGYIKLDRKLLENDLWKEKPFDKARAWVDLLLLANYKDFEIVHNGHTIQRKRGEVNTSIPWLANRWGWSENKVRRFLGRLNECAMSRTNGSANGSTITIENYTKYQDGGRANGRANGRADGRANERHDKNNKEKIEKKEIYAAKRRRKSSFLEDLENLIEGEDE